MKANVESIEKEYRAAQTGGVMLDAAAWGRLRFTGQHRLDFLQRMSTNDLLKLQIGQGAGTVFTTPIARIIDRVVVYVREAELLMLTSRGNQGRVAQWLRKYLFFNDDVQIQDVTHETAQVSIYGAEADQVLQRLCHEDLAALPKHHWRAASIAGVEAVSARADPLGGGGFHVMVPAAAQPALWQALLAAGSVPIGEEAYQILRVEAGRPEFGRELGDDYIPLEANLWEDVSFKKGCYTGQEIIARLESRQRLAKQLVGLRLAEEIQPRATLWAGEQEVGSVTSVVYSPLWGWIGLGYVKAAPALMGKALEARSSDQTVVGTTAATVVALPFTPDRLA